MSNREVRAVGAGNRSSRFSSVVVLAVLMLCSCLRTPLALFESADSCRCCAAQDPGPSTPGTLPSGDPTRGTSRRKSARAWRVEANKRQYILVHSVAFPPLTQEYDPSLWLHHFSQVGRSDLAKRASGHIITRQQQGVALGSTRIQQHTYRKGERAHVERRFDRQSLLKATMRTCRLRAWYV